MHVHKYEKLWLLASVLLIVGFISTIVFGAVGAGVKMVDDSGGKVNASDLSNPESNFSETGVRKVGPNEYEVYVIAQQFIFDPEKIEVPAESNVTFYVTSRDVIHGFGVAETNINTMAVPGEVSELSVKNLEPGTYGIVCNEYCGASHHTMEGKLIVREPGNFTMADDSSSQGSSNSTETEQATNETDEA